jgi:hypothetical protein
VRSGQLVAGRYRLEEVIGSGGMGVVWLATDLRLERPVAVKRASVPNRRGARQLLREAKNAARLHHPNSVAVFDAVEDEDGHCWLVMEYVPSTSLADLMLRDPGPSLEAVMSIGAQVADALAAMHALGIVHRDVKPGNVLVTEQGVAKLTDFGIATWQEVTVTETGPVPCTPGYLAPEVANGRDATAASDVFSLGAALYAALEGMPPFGRGDVQLVMRRARAGSMPAPANAGELTPVLAALMATDPAARPSAAAAHELLTDAKGGKDATIPGSPHTLLRRKPVAVAAAATAAVAVVVALVAWLAPGGDVRGTPGTSHSEAAGKPTLGAEPAAADPCALMSAKSYADFGDPKLDKDYGSFARCDVLVSIGADDDVDVSVELDDAEEDDDLPALTVRKDDDEEAEDACVRTVIIGDGHVAVVAAHTYNKSGTTAADLCAMADTAASDAVDALRRGPVPRRREEPPAESIANFDACKMADEQVVAQVPAVDPRSPMAGFGHWNCRWSDPEDGPSSLLLLFDRNPPYDPEEGRPIRLGDHDAFVFPRGYGDDTCEVSVIHRRYVNENDEDMIEALLVVVYGDGPPEPLCAKARQVASRVAGNLPPV